MDKLKLVISLHRATGVALLYCKRELDKHNWNYEETVEYMLANINEYTVVCNVKK